MHSGIESGSFTAAKQAPGMDCVSCGVRGRVWIELWTEDGQDPDEVPVEDERYTCRACGYRWWGSTQEAA